MFNFEEEIKAWKQLLDSGEIDKITYEYEVNKLVRKNERIKQQRRRPYKQHKRIDKPLLLKLSLEIGIFLIVIYFMIFNLSSFNIINETTKNVEYVTSLSNIGKPKQSKTSGEFEKEVDGINVEITCVAEYSISGRIVDVQSYYGYNVFNKLSPIDVGMSWGFLANDKNNSKVQWSTYGDRLLRYNVSDGMWVNEVGGMDKISEHCSNNHLIPSDKQNRKYIYLIQVGDFVRIDGYLVNLRYKEGNSIYTYDTSTSRTDLEEGACEIIYVTNVTWLEQK